MKDDVDLIINVNTIDQEWSHTGNAPSVYHVDEKRWNQMIAKGLNTTVLQKLEFTLGQTKYVTGEIPSYRTITHFCTCGLTKSTLLKIKDFQGKYELTQGSMEKCPVNELYAIIDRQAGALVSMDKDIGRHFALFAKQFHLYVLEKMKNDHFTINFD